MISDLQPLADSVPAVPYGTVMNIVQPGAQHPANISPRATTGDAVPRRRDAAHHALPECDENRLRSETRALCSACAMVYARVRSGQSVQSACKSVLNLFPLQNWKLGTFRQKYDWWVEAKDWTTPRKLAPAPELIGLTAISDCPKSFWISAPDALASSNAKTPPARRCAAFAANGKPA